MNRLVRHPIALALALAVLARCGGPAPTLGPGTGDPDRAAVEAADRAIGEAFRDRRSDLWVETRGEVERILPDDKQGSRHQRFIVRLGSGQTLLISHNIDLAPRVPLVVGDTLDFRGEYEWNDRGGVVHWTHHDPRGRRDGGWIRHRGKLYR